MKLQKSFRCKTANYSILCESYLHHGPVKTNSFIPYYTEWPLDIISCCVPIPAVWRQTKEKSPISLSVSKEWTSIKLYEDFFWKIH